MPRLLRQEPSRRIVRQSFRQSFRHLARLWQVPLLLVSLALFGGAAYLLLDPQGGMSSQQKIERARAFLKTDRPDAAVEQLNRMLGARKMERADEAIVHVMLAEAIDASMTRRGVSDPAQHQQIIEQTQMGLSLRAKPSGEIQQRVGDSLVALGKSAEAITRYRDALAVDPAHAVALSRKIIELQMSRGDSSAGASIDQFLVRRDIADSERAWALTSKSQLLINAGDCFEARSLLRDAVRLDDDAQAVGAASLRIAQSALKLGSVDEAQRAAQVAHDQLSPAHVDKPAATLLLAGILREKKELVSAAACYDELLKDFPASAQAATALLGRAICHADQPQLAASDLRQISQQAKVDDRGLVAALWAAEKHFKGAALVELLSSQVALQSQPAPQLSQRLAVAIQDQMPAANPEQLKELCTRLAAVIDRFASTQPDDALAADALLHLAAAQTQLGSSAAAATHQRILNIYPATPSVSPAALALAKIELAKFPPDNAAAEKLFIRVVSRDSKGTAEQQKQASAQLAALYARTDRPEQAIAQLESLTKKYPKDEGSIEFLSLLAECYRAKAGVPSIHLVSAQLADAKAGAADAEAEKQRNLLKAKSLFDQVISLENGAHPNDADKGRIERAYFRRADCLFDLAKFAEAIPLYQSATKRYDGQPASLAAYVQLVNAYSEIEKVEESKAAHARAVAILAQHPDAGASVPKAYWEQWLNWTSPDETR